MPSRNRDSGHDRGNSLAEHLAKGLDEAGVLPPPKHMSRAALIARLSDNTIR